MEPASYELLMARSARHGATVEEEAVEAIERVLDRDRPNAGLLSLIGIAEGATKPASWLHTDEFRDEYAESLRAQNGLSPAEAREDEGPNAEWFEMIRASAAIDDGHRPHGPWPPVDSDLVKELMARDTYRDAFNRELDW